MTNQTQTGEDTERTENDDQPAYPRVLRLDARNTAEAIVEKIEFEEPWFVGRNGSVPGTHARRYAAWDKMFSDAGEQPFVPVQDIRDLVPVLSVDEGRGGDRSEEECIELSVIELKGRNIEVPVLFTTGHMSDEEYRQMVQIRIREDVDGGISEVGR